MFPLINKRETDVNLRRIMYMRGVTPKDVQEYLIDAIVCGNRATIAPDKQLDSRESRLCAYYEKLHEKRAA